MPLPRRLRSFSLRTLMVLFTMACMGAAWLATEYRTVQARKAAFSKWEREGRDLIAYSAVSPTGKPHDGSDWPTVSWVRRQLGDVAIAAIVSTRPSQLPRAEIRKLFPEAQISLGPPGKRSGPVWRAPDPWDRTLGAWKKEPQPPSP